jgi:hypothetical protein
MVKVRPGMTFSLLESFVAQQIRASRIVYDTGFRYNVYKTPRTGLIR